MALITAISVARPAPCFRNRSHLVAAIQIRKTSAVQGKVRAQYTQKLSCITPGLSHLRDGIANSAAKKVPGKNTMVIMATVFMAELSSAVAFANAVLALANPMLVVESSCVIRAKT
jgi:hypothetical protein